ncbi:MAG TPA: hypothetical protein VGX25_06015 [Actinophytocola sp.]|nr:hypothetical protein [Actinophytocola sp.]
MSDMVITGSTDITGVTRSAGDRERLAGLERAPSRPTRSTSRRCAARSTGRTS